MSNVKVEIIGDTGYGYLPDGRVLLFDTDKADVVRSQKWYYCPNKNAHMGYVCNCKGWPIHSYLVERKKGYEVDHINLNTLDNRSSNLRLVTHQCNQINQPPQSNNRTGVSGVQYEARRRQYRARIKIGQKDIHLGCYETFQQAVQARNVGMECMFGEYGRYNDVPPAPEWIRQKVIKQCERFAELSVCRAFLLKYANKPREGGRTVGYQRKKAPAYCAQGA